MKHLLLLIIITFISCGHHKPEEAMFKEAALASADFNSNETDATNPGITIERKLIKNGDLTIEVNDVKKTKETIESICKTLNAYIANESQNNFENRLQYNQIIRVPSVKFDSLLQKLENLAEEIESKSINTQDVTEEFIDVEARLKTKKELENRYLEILRVAKSVSDIVAVENQIATVRSEIESMQGRLNYLKNQVAFSTLNLSFYENKGTDFGFASKVARGFSQGWDNLLSFLIFMVNLWPFLLITAGTIFLVARWKRRYSKKIENP